MWYITHKALVAALLILVASVALMWQLGLLTGSRGWQILLLATCIVCQPIEAGKIHAQCVCSFIKTSEASFWGNVTSVWVWAHLKGSLWHAQRAVEGIRRKFAFLFAVCVWWPSWNQLLLCQYSKICSGLTCLSNWVSTSGFSVVGMNTHYNHIISCEYSWQCPLCNSRVDSLWI